MEAEKDQLYYSGNEFHKVSMTGLVGLTRDGVLGWSAGMGTSGGGSLLSWKGDNVYPHL